MSVSPSTGIRLVDSLPIPSVYQVSVLGIDDWAYRKGLSYGTILVNIEEGKVIELLTERDGVSLKKWSVDQPEVKIVTRDRASAYSSAVSTTLPNAIQVADRFHLLKNFSDCVYVIHLEYKNLSNSLNEGPSLEETISPEFINVEPVGVPRKEKGEAIDYIISRFDKVEEMLKDGYKIKAIAKSLQIARNTFRCYSKMDFLPNKAIYLRNNYNEYQEIIEKEFSEGKCLTEVFYSMKKNWLYRGRTSFYEQFKDHPMRTNPVKMILAPVKFKLISPREITGFLQMADLSKIKDNADMKMMASLLSNNQLLEKLRFQALSFKEMLLGNDDSILED